jgi:hypothetical protein
VVIGTLLLDSPQPGVVGLPTRSERFWGSLIVLDLTDARLELSMRCMSEIIVSRSGSGRCSNRLVSPDAGSRQDTARAGIPTAVVCGGTSFRPLNRRPPAPLHQSSPRRAPTRRRR